MKKTDVNDYIVNQVKLLVDNASNSKNIKKLIKKHNEKSHPMPIRYRLLGGLLHSMNIRFGNFIEVLMKEFIRDDGRYEIIEELSGKKNNKFNISKENEDRINDYISNCRRDKDYLNNFQKLLEDIVNCKTKCNETFDGDIDLLFRDKVQGKYYYLEMKYYDDHDSGKIVNINEKFIKTYAFLSEKLNIQKASDLTPILFYFSGDLRMTNRFIPEETNIRKGEDFFKEFLKIEYKDVDVCLTNLSESCDNIKTFDELYNKIMNLDI
ncbi:MAG: restriction endonuclease [Abditibacteriota bacterium]|nr:restriction endonuclease [Abditibacteriota bacterium]